MAPNVLIKAQTLSKIHDLQIFQSTIRRRVGALFARLHLPDLLTYFDAHSLAIIPLYRIFPSATGMPNSDSDPLSPELLPMTSHQVKVDPAIASSSGSATAMATLPEPTDIVTWAFSGSYDSSRPIFTDAIDPSRYITKELAVSMVARLAGAFKPGNTVCLHLDNDILYPILSLAIYASNCRWTGTNTSNKVSELEHLFQASDAKYIVTAVEHLGAVKAAVANIESDAEIILFTDILEDRPYRSPRCGREYDSGHKSETFRDLHDLLSDGTTECLARMLKDIDPNSIATLMTTSGTTGRPKMAARSHAATVFETAAIAQNEHIHKSYQVRRLFCTPIFHAFTMPEMVINAIRLGHSAYFLKRFDDVVFPAKIAEFNITETLAPPGMLLRLTNNPGCHAQLQSLRTIFTGGAPLVPELKAKFLNIYPESKPRIAPVWGMTEGGWFSTLKYPEDDTTGSVGRMLPGYEIKMCLKDPVKLSNGRETGELLVRGPQLMAGYLDNPEANRNAFIEDGWLRTGDIGYVTGDGKVYLVDRAKDLIKVNGWQVSPAELEDALLVSPDVKDSGVIGTGENVNEHPLAFVVPASPNVTASKLKEHMLTQLAGYKVRSCEFQFIDEIPRGVTGKILRNELKALAIV